MHFNYNKIRLYYTFLLTKKAKHNITNGLSCIYNVTFLDKKSINCNRNNFILIYYYNY